MPSAESVSEPKKAYWVEERLFGTANYLVYASSAKAAEQAIRDGNVQMFDSQVGHSGTFRTRRLPSEDR
jgi:hypothetical protein